MDADGGCRGLESSLIPTDPGHALVAGVLLVAALLVAGCSAGKPMVLSKAKSAAEFTKPIGVFTLRTENRYKTNYQAHTIVVETVGEATRRKTMWTSKKPLRSAKDAFNEYLVSVQLDPGAYRMGRVIGGAGDQILVAGFFKIQAGLRFELPQSGVTYLGHVDLINRERKEGEPHSGQMLPLIDQAVTGYYNGTTDILVSDAAEQDLPAILQAYPYLQGVQIQKAILTQVPTER